MSPVDESRRPGGGTIPSKVRSDGPERWGRVKALFLQALEHPEAERDAFVAAASGGDTQLREEVGSLLASEKAAASFCESPAAQMLEAAGPANDKGARLEPGTRLGAYEITDFIAAGGMGAVYRARHTVLGREVAIKTIGPGLADEAARRRLIREAKNASVLAHPNLCAIHDVGETDGVPFIVMEYVKGRSLAELVRETIPPLGDVLRYGVQIAAALKHAHERGIIHRDLKSSNIVIGENGEAIVLDFGLARRLRDGEQSADATLTQPHALAGTLSHMAPEVLRGERADVRSDIWALGVLLYEMVTGRLPFSGRTQFETSSAILGEPPSPFESSVPLALRLVIERCLVKDPAGRYQDAGAVLDALDAIRRRRAWPVVGRLLISARRRTIYAAAAAGLLIALLAVAAVRLRDQLGATPRVATLALLPLENATGDSAAGYYAEGITDALIAQLGAATDIRVFSRASTSPAARRGRSITEIAGQLGADIVAQGALRRSPQRIAIDVRLLRPRDGRAVWSETYERDPREILALEADVVRGLAGAIQLTLTPEVRQRLAAVRAVSPEVYEAYLKGRYEWNKRTRASLQEAIAQFNRAVELDPTYAPAHAALADCFNQLGTVMVGTGSPLQYRPRAAAAAIAALQIDPYSAEAHAALGYVWHYEWRWADAEKEFRRAIELNPSYSMARIWYANMLMSRLRMDEAIEQVTTARELDPFSLIVNTNVGWVLAVAGRTDQAIDQLRQTLALDSSYLQARWRLAGVLASAGRFDEALVEANRLVVMSDSAAPLLSMLANVEARAGMRRQATALLDELVLRSRREYVPPASIAMIFNALGDVDNTMVWLEKAFAEGSNAIAYLASDYRSSKVRQDPRYLALLARAGLK